MMIDWMSRNQHQIKSYKIHESEIIWSKRFPISKVR